MGKKKIPATPTAVVNRVKDHLGQLLAFTSNTVFVLDRKGCFILIQQGAAQITGHAAEELLNQHFSILLDEVALKTGNDHFMRAIIGGERVNRLELGLRHKDGSRRIALVSGIPLLDRKHVVGAIGIAEDITERRLADAALRESEEKFRATFNQAAVGIAHINLTGAFQQVNEKLCQILDYRPDELCTLDLHAITHPADLSRSRSHLQSLADGTLSTCTLEIRLLRKGAGAVWVNITQSLVRDAQDQPKYLIAVVDDISERKRSEQLVRQLNLELEGKVLAQGVALLASNKELEAFSYAVSHDLRAPLRAINGFSYALMEDYGQYLDEQGMEHLRRIRQATQQMGELIDDLLDLTHVIRGQVSRQSVNLSRLAEEVAEELRDMYPGVAVDFQVAPDMQTFGDTHLLRVVLQNLLGNAWKFTRHCDHPRVEFGISQLDDKRAYFVRDNGAGFDMAYANKLFGPFQRLHGKGEFEGTGIGLAIVQRIIDRHGGSIWAESEVGKGAVFYFTLGERLI